MVVEMKINLLIGCILATGSLLFSDVKVVDGEITRLEVERWKGTWAAPGGNYIEKLKIKVHEHQLVNPDENDEKIIELIQSGESFDVLLGSYASSFSASNEDYKYLLKHHVPFTTRVFPRLKFNGILQWNISKNEEYNEETSKYEPITEILLIRPDYTSKWGEFKDQSPRPVELSRKIQIFHELYDE